ncbi:ATP-binding cassette domain-containing protein [Desulfocurvibacter africanus]|uniref:ATP-binding cassette domain-containing protein n=1 Tax=Desulfocurvibacter africanus TaxID=873 RepID=UPI00040DAC08|nr:ATP-binding cassette domain-containing protein [Desulfocurvibacter africanus]
MAREPLIEFRGVTKAFGERVILDKVDLCIYERQVTTIIGKSGVGKSVLLKHIIGLLTPDEGEVLFRGKALSAMSGEERRAVKRQFSYMFQHNALFDSMTNFENIALPLREKTRMSETEIREKVMAKMSQLELAEVPDKYPSQISGGMAKRVALARALITDPAIVLFDEPTTGLDPIRKNAVLSMIAHYQKRFGFTAVLVSHDIPDVFYISNRIAILYERKFIFEGSPLDLEQLDHPVVEEFANSLQSLKDELTGLDTRRRFERRYLRGFAGSKSQGAIIVFRIENLGSVEEHVGHIAAQHVIQSLASIVDRTVGGAGYSARFSTDEILTVLPENGVREAENICKEVGRELKKLDVLQHKSYPRNCFNFSIHAGVVPGRQGADLKELAAGALARQRVLAQLECQNPERRSDIAQ